MSKSAAILPIYYPIDDKFSEVSDYYLKTKKFRVLGITLMIFLSSLWIVANFSGSGFNISTLKHYNKNSEAALAAAAVLGESGEEGIHGLEVENHGRIGPNGHNHGIHEPLDLKYYFDSSSSSKDSNQDQHFLISDIIKPNIARQRFEEALKNDYLYFDDIDSEPLSTIELEINELVLENPVVIFSKSYCLYSQRVRHILSLYHITPNILVVNIDKREDGDEFKQALIKYTNRDTFPSVFVDGKSIGGIEELAMMHVNGRLNEILIEAGVIIDDSDSEQPNHVSL